MNIKVKKLDILEAKRKQIEEVTNEYRAVMDRIEQLLGRPLTKWVDGKLKIMTPEYIEKVAKYIYEVAKETNDE